MKERFITKNASKFLRRTQHLRLHQFGTSDIPQGSRELSYLASFYCGSNSTQARQLERQNGFGIHYHQVRFRRHDRASAFSKPRPPTRKKRRAYNRKMKKEADDRARHSAPGSQAGPRRQWAENRWQDLLIHGKHVLPVAEKDDEYTHEDAILEDLVANTSYLTSQPTPEPVYLGHRHKEFYDRVADQMDEFREAVENFRISEEDKNGNVLLSEAPISLPSDEDISKTLRAYRDRHGTRQKPVGIVKALQHLLQDLGLPTSTFGEYTYTTLMTCCQTPREGRRIFKLMRDQNHEISSYSWSILVDIHAKLGDFEGCGEVIKEMASYGGHAPTLAAYTSLLAACYKVCNDSGRNSHAVRAKAGTFGWKSWQEMRIAGIEPDVMAYGAILRLCAARGHPERAMDLLLDMERFEVKPTTLCFTAALKSVARSHEIANRYQRGSSRRDMKRENITGHHGKMARQIVILAEAAEVQQDDGFTSALILCAAAAGDSASAKAILLASEVRKLDHLRTIGGSRSDALNGHDSDLRLDSGSTAIVNKGTGDPNDRNNRVKIVNRTLVEQPENLKHKITYGEREYGKDTRVISAFVHSCAQALNKNGLGTIWAGRENLGYLCDNSLRLISTRWEPTYKDTSVPGVSSTKVGIGSLRHMDEREKDYEYTPGKRKKFRGLFIDEDDVATIDDIKRDDFESDHCDEFLSDRNQYKVSKNLDDEKFENFSIMMKNDNTISKEDGPKSENGIDEQDFGSGEIMKSIDQGNEIQLLQENNSSGYQVDSTSNNTLNRSDSVELSRMQDLQMLLPGMPLHRIKKVLNAYDKTLGHPSMLTLVPILREVMPDYVSSGWLKRSNKQNADFALQKASDDGIIDSSLLNAMLEVKANSGSLNEAIEYHENEFANHEQTPSAYSDRLLLQMFVTNKRLGRALAFKEKIEKEGRQLDIASYGSLIQFCSRQQQLGSGLLFLKECLAMHGAAPSEACLSDLRSMCKRKQLEDIVGFIEMVGRDPNEWLKHGQKNLKRESSRKGRRNVQQAQNRLL